MTSAQICARAVSIAKSKGGLTVAGILLNAVLQELCQTYDFEVCRGTYSFAFNPNSVASANFPNNVSGSGPYALPADYLRVQKDEFFWFLNGEPFEMINVDMAEFDAQVQQKGNQSYPGIFATDLSTAPATMVIFPPASGNYAAMLRYMRAMADIGSNAAAQGAWVAGAAAPEVSTVVPWFPSATYLYTRVAGELMKDSSDSRERAYLGDGTEENPGLAAGILHRYLLMKDDHEGRTYRVTLDKRRFRPSPGRLADTKKVWG